jgi:hypothetical protein
VGRKDARRKEEQLEKERAKMKEEEKRAPKVTFKLKVIAPKAGGAGTKDKRNKGKNKAVEIPTPPKATEDDANDSGPGIWDGAGWDSDLSALTESEGESRVEVHSR